MKIRLSPVTLARLNAGLPIYDSTPLGGQIIDRFDELSRQKQRYLGYTMKSETHVKPTKDISNQSYKGVEEHGTLPDFVQALASGRDPRINGWKYLRLTERPEHIGESKIPGDICRPKAGTESSNNDEFIKNSTGLDEKTPQNATGSSWPYTSLVLEEQNSSTSVANNISAEYSYSQQSKLFGDILQEDYNSLTEASSSYNNSISALVDAQKEQQEDSLAQSCADSEGISYIEKYYFSSPAEIRNDSAQECQYLLGGILFEDLTTDSSEPYSQQKSNNLEIYEKNNNIPQENYQISAWQTEFLNEREDEIPELLEL